MRPTGVPRLERLGESKESVVRGKPVRNQPPGMQLSHAFSWVLCVFLRFFAQYSMNLYVYATDFGRCPFECSAGPCRRRTAFGTTCRQSCRPVWSKYRTCRTHKYGRRLDHARNNLYRPQIDGSPSLKAQHAHLSPMAIRSRTGPTIIEKSYKPAARSSAQSDQWFCYVLNWQTRTQSFFIRTSLIKLSWAHTPFRLSCAQVHISQLLRNFKTTVCLHALKQTELKLHVLRQ